MRCAELCRSMASYPIYTASIFGSYTSVPTFAVSLTSVHFSRKTTLRLANVSGINPAHSGLSPFGLCKSPFLFLYLHRNWKQAFQSAIRGTHISLDVIFFVFCLLSLRKNTRKTPPALHRYVSISNNKI